VTLRADLVRFTNPGKPHREIPWSWPRVLRAVLAEQGAWAVIEYRLRHAARRFGVPGRALGLVSQKAVEILTGISISSTAEIGPGLYIGHFGGIFVGAGVRIGEDCNLSQQVTLGLAASGSPVLGDRVYVAPGAKVSGAVTVGDDARIGANAVVVRDVDPGATAVGVPAHR
jgi:serine O-acetyltransferase